jgi:hypothetical protein
MAIRQTKKISELNTLASASLNTYVLGIDNGATYKITLDVLEDAVVNMVSRSTDLRLDSLEYFSSSYSPVSIPIGTISSSVQISNFGFISSSHTDITSLNSFTSSQDILNTAFTNGINARLQTSSFNDFSASVHSEIVSATNEQSFNGLISGSSQLTSSYDERYVISGSITQTTWDNIANKPSGIVSQSTDLTPLNNFTASISTASLVDRLNAIENVSGSWITESETGSFLTSLNGAISSSSQLTSSFDIRYTLSGSVQPLPLNLVSSSAQITAFGFISSSATIPVGTISGSSQLTSSFDSRYVLESETGSLQTSITNLNSFTQSFSTSVDSRFDTLEATIISGSPNYTQVLGNRRTGITSVGTSIVSGSITTTGNPVQIMVTGDANPIGGTAWARLQIFRDGNGIGNIIQVENTSNLNVPYCLNVIDTPSAGTYTYSMRTTDNMAGTFDFGESTGPLLTAVELRTNTNLPSTNNVFTGTNRFNGQVTIGGTGGDEGGELQLVTAQTNTTLTGSYASVDIYRDRLRIFEGGGTFRGVHVDLSKAPAGVAGELIWKASGFVDAGTFVSLDNIKCTVTTSGNRGLSLGAVSTSYTANISGQYTVSGGTGGGTANNGTYTTTASTSLYNWHFPTEGDGSQYQILDKTNNRVYRVSLMIGASYLNNFISIERLY